MTWRWLRSREAWLSWGRSLVLSRTIGARRDGSGWPTTSSISSLRLAPELASPGSAWPARARMRGLGARVRTNIPLRARKCGSAGFSRAPGGCDGASSTQANAGTRLAVRGQAAASRARLRDFGDHARASGRAENVRQGLPGLPRLRADFISRRRPAARDASGLRQELRRGADPCAEPV